MKLSPRVDVRQGRIWIGRGIVTLTVLIHGKALETELVTPLQRWQRSIPPSPRAGRGGELAG
jgi:hypothetical protein